MSERLLLGVDEGTTGVKAALFDERLEPVAEARRDKVNRHPREGWVEQDRTRCSRSWSRRSRELLADPPGRGGRLRARPPGRVGPRLGGRYRQAALADRRLAGQALAGDPRPARAIGEERGEGAQRAPLRPLLLRRRSSPGCSSTTTAVKQRPGRRAICGSARSTPSSATGSAPASPPTPRPRRAPSSSTLGRPGFDPTLCEIFGVPPEVLPEVRDSAGELGTLQHESWPIELPLRGQVVDQQAALAGAACVEPGRVKATYGTGVFVLAHVGDRGPEAGGRSAADRRLEHRRTGGVRARRRRLRRRGDAGVDVQASSASPRTRRR